MSRKAATGIKGQAATVTDNVHCVPDGTRTSGIRQTITRTALGYFVLIIEVIER
jgi:hypothetical protein